MSAPLSLSENSGKNNKISADIWCWLQSKLDDEVEKPRSLIVLQQQGFPLGKMTEDEKNHIHLSSQSFYHLLVQLLFTQQVQ